MSNILLIAGYDKSLYSLVVAESLRQAGTTPAMILVGYPFSAARLKALIRTRGLKAIARYAMGRSAADGPVRSPLIDYATSLGLEFNSLRNWSKQWGVRCTAVTDLNSTSCAALVQKLRPERTLYTGGGILRRGILEAANRRVLNAHSGPLPAIRGMNACEWSLLLNQPLSVTIHFIDEGIDTGAELERIPVDAENCQSLDQLRETCSVTGAKGLLKWALNELPTSSRWENTAPTKRTRQCFVVSPALREIVEAKLPDLIARQQKGSDEK